MTLVPERVVAVAEDNTPPPPSPLLQVIGAIERLSASIAAGPAPPRRRIVQKSKVSQTERSSSVLIDVDEKKIRSQSRELQKASERIAALEADAAASAEALKAGVKERERLERLVERMKRGGDGSASADWPPPPGAPHRRDARLRERVHGPAPLTAHRTKPLRPCQEPTFRWTRRPPALPRHLRPPLLPALATAAGLKIRRKPLKLGP